MRIVNRTFYVDDCLKSTPTTADAVSLVSELRSLLLQGRFRLTIWITTDREVLSTIPESERATSLTNLDIGTALPFEKVLGLQWNRVIPFEFNINLQSKPAARRDISSLTSSL